MTVIRNGLRLSTSLETLAQVLAIVRGDVLGFDACESAALTDLMCDKDEEPRLDDGRIGYTVMVYL